MAHAVARGLRPRHWPPIGVFEGGPEPSPQVEREFPSEHKSDCIGRSTKVAELIHGPAAWEWLSVGEKMMDVQEPL